MDITNTAVEVSEHWESEEEDTILEKVDQGELEVKTTHYLPNASRVDLYRWGGAQSHNHIPTVVTCIEVRLRF